MHIIWISRRGRQRAQSKVKKEGRRCEGGSCCLSNSSQQRGRREERMKEGGRINGWPLSQVTQGMVGSRFHASLLRNWINDSAKAARAFSKLTAESSEQICQNSNSFNQPDRSILRLIPFRGAIFQCLKRRESWSGCWSRIQWPPSPFIQNSRDSSWSNGCLWTRDSHNLTLKTLFRVIENSHYIFVCSYGINCTSTVL